MQINKQVKSGDDGKLGQFQLQRVQPPTCAVRVPQEQQSTKTGDYYPAPSWKVQPSVWLTGVVAVLLTIGY